jgi:DHA1 family bicyclomycin/chloramphenicol resistance-like MFS transporter
MNSIKQTHPGGQVNAAGLTNTSKQTNAAGGTNPGKQTNPGRPVKQIRERHRRAATILSLALIPLSGFATDIYLPSFPAMVSGLHATNGQIQFSLLIFLISGGISQLFVGGLLDSYGRFRLSNAALLAFAAASFAIGMFPNLYVLYAMRVVHGVAVAFIVVAKRAYFLDVFTGDKLKSYTSLFSIVWATAPIVAPFLGGYLQEAFGWQSNFYFLGGMTLVILALTIYYGGESAVSLSPFRPGTIMKVYASMLRTGDFVLSLVINALAYAMLLVFGMSSPFIIEQVFHHSPVVTGYSALLSGAALMTGGIISKSMLRRSLDRKIKIAMGLQTVLALGMVLFFREFGGGLGLMLAFVAMVHLLAGFVFNNLFSYALGRFTSHGGIVSGLTGGGNYVITSVFSYGAVGLLAIKSPAVLGVAYLSLAVLSGLAFGLFQRARAGVKILGTAGSVEEAAA